MTGEQSEAATAEAPPSPLSPPPPSAPPDPNKRLNISSLTPSTSSLLSQAPSTSSDPTTRSEQIGNNIGSSSSEIVAASSSTTSQGPLLVLPPPPPQNDDVNNNENGNLNPITQIIRDQELGKATLALAVPIVLAVLFTNMGKLLEWEVILVLTGLSIGCMAILIGILYRNTFPKVARVFEPVGICLVIFSLYGVIGFVLHGFLKLIPTVTALLSLLPFIQAALEREPSSRTSV